MVLLYDVRQLLYTLKLFKVVLTLDRRGWKSKCGGGLKGKGGTGEETKKED